TGGMGVSGRVGLIATPGERVQAGRPRTDAQPGHAAEAYRFAAEAFPGEAEIAETESSGARGVPGGGGDVGWAHGDPTGAAPCRPGGDVRPDDVRRRSPVECLRTTRAARGIVMGPSRPVPVTMGGDPPYPPAKPVVTGKR